MSSVQLSQPGQRTAVHFPVPQEDLAKVDDIQVRIAAAVEAFSQGLLYMQYLGQHGLVRTITSSEEIGPLMREGLVLRSSGEKLYLARTGLLGGSPLDELEKKLQNKPADKRSVFISYQWSQKDLARSIQVEFEAKGFLAIRDESNLSQGVYLPGFMRILNHPNLDYVLVIVSDSYMKSKNCMYEVNQTMNRYSFVDTLLPFVMTDDPTTKADIYNGVQKYLVHWQSELEEAKAAQDVDSEEVIQNILKNCKTFANAIRTRINISEADLKSQRYQPFFDLIDQREKEKAGSGFKEIEALLDKSVRLEKLKKIKEAEECYTAAQRKVEDFLHLDGIDPLCARLYGAYSEFLRRQKRAEEAAENLEIAKSFGYEGNSSGASSPNSAAIAQASSSVVSGSSHSQPVVAVQALSPAVSGSNDSQVVAAAARASLLAAVEQTPSKFIEAAKVLKSEEDVKVLVNAFAFGKDKWEKYFGPIGVVPALPKDIVEILCSDDPFNTDVPRKKVAETHMLVLVPTTVKGEPLNLRSFRERVKAPLAGNKSDYWYLYDEVDKKYGGVSSTHAQWVLMTKDVISGSRGKQYVEQKRMVEGKPQYEVPDLLSASVGILAHYVKTGERLFVDEPWTYTRCKELVGRYQSIVGGFAPAGLILYHDLDYDEAGAAALRKFF